MGAGSGGGVRGCREDTGGAKGRERRLDVGCEHLGSRGGGVAKLQHLHEEFNVERAARTALQVVGRGFALQSEPRAAQLRNVGVKPRPLDEKLPEQRCRAIAGRGVAKYRPGLAEGLPLPKRRRAGSKMLREVGKGYCQRAADANGT